MSGEGAGSATHQNDQGLKPSQCPGLRKTLCRGKIGLDPNLGAEQYVVTRIGSAQGGGGAAC